MKRVYQPVVNTPALLLDLVQKLSSAKFLAVDTEFIRETTFYPRVALIQVATLEDSWLVDPLALDRKQLTPLFDLLQNQQIIKVMHAAQADQECLYTTYQIVAQPVFDTAMAASLCGFGESAGLARLLKEVLQVSIDKGHTRTDWMARPLPQHLQVYAHEDVIYLVKLAQALIDRLDKKNRTQWAYELSSRYQNTALYSVNVESATQKIIKNKRINKRVYQVLMNLVEFRENKAREINIPRRRLMEDDVLFDLAVAQPRDLNHLSHFRGLSKHDLKVHGSTIIDAILRGLEVAEHLLKEPPKPDMVDASYLRSIELVQFFLKYQSDACELAPKYLMNSDDIIRLLKKDSWTHQELVQEKILTEGACALIGSELIAFLNGQRYLGLADGKVVLK